MRYRITMADNQAVFRLPTMALMLLLLTLVWMTADAAPPTAVEITQPLALNQAVRLALARNLDIKSAENALQAAEAARRAAVGKRYPHIKALIWYNGFPQQKSLLLPGHMDVPSLSEIDAPTAKQTQENMLNYLDAQFQSRVLNIGLGLNWPLYTGGRLTAEVTGKDAEANAANYRLSRIRQQLVFAVTQTYLGIVVAQHSEQTVEISIKHLTEARLNLQEFVKVGEKPRLDLLRVGTRLEQMRQVLADVQVQLVTVQGNLRRLLDLDPSGPPLKLAGGDAASGGKSEIPPMSAALEQALVSRPDYQALDSEVAAQRARLLVAQGKRLPEVNLSVRTWEAHGNRIGGPISTWEPNSQITLSASIPLFTGGILRAQVDQGSARLDEISHRLTGLAQRVRWEVTQAYAQLRAAYAKLDAARAGVRSADEAFRVEREKNAVGAGTVTDLLGAQAADLSSQTSFYQAQAGIRVSLTRLELVIGVLDRQPYDTAHNAGQ